MGFDNLSSFFKKFDHLRIPDETVRKTAAEVIQDVVGVPIDIKAVQFRKGIVTVSADPMVKSEIFLRKSDIVSRLQTLCKDKGVIDIR